MRGAYSRSAPVATENVSSNRVVGGVPTDACYRHARPGAWGGVDTAKIFCLQFEMPVVDSFYLGFLQVRAEEARPNHVTVGRRVPDVVRLASPRASTGAHTHIGRRCGAQYERREVRE